MKRTIRTWFMAVLLTALAPIAMAQSSLGQSQNVTFIALRYMRNGETVGSHFDLNVTFGQYTSAGEGHIHHVRNYPFTAIGLSRL